MDHSADDGPTMPDLQNLPLTWIAAGAVAGIVVLALVLAFVETRRRRARLRRLNRAETLQRM